jgi:hypothetical protein
MKLIFSDFVITGTDTVSFSDLPEREQSPFLNLKDQIKDKLQDVHCYVHAPGKISVRFALERQVPAAFIFVCCAGSMEEVRHKLSDLHAPLHFAKALASGNSDLN